MGIAQQSGALTFGSRAPVLSVEQQRTLGTQRLLLASVNVRVRPVTLPSVAHACAAHPRQCTRQADHGCGGLYAWRPGAQPHGTVN
jgi:hypothetical protein